jgi:ankyrin repeat protein
VAELLIRKGAKVNARGIGGFTPLHGAAHAGNAEGAELLLHNGAEVDAPDDAAGSTPLHVAAYVGSDEVVGLLIERGADINARQKSDGLTPLDMAAEGRSDWRGSKAAVVRLLTSKGGKRSKDLGESRGE